MPRKTSPHALVAALQPRVVKPLQYPAHMPLTLGFTTQHPGRHRCRTRQKLFQTLDAAQALSSISITTSCRSACFAQRLRRVSFTSMQKWRFCRILLIFNEVFEAPRRA